MMNLSYNVILNKPFFHEINAVISSKYLIMKFPTVKGVTIMKGSQLILKR